MGDGLAGELDRREQVPIVRGRETPALRVLVTCHQVTRRSEGSEDAEIAQSVADRGDAGAHDVLVDRQGRIEGTAATPSATPARTAMPRA